MSSDRAACEATLRSPWWRVRPALVAAFVASIAVHIAISQLPDEIEGDPLSLPLTATIRELPPPPTAAPPPPPKAPAPRKPPARKPAAPSTPAPAAAPAPVASQEASAAPSAEAAQSDAGPTQGAPAPAEAPAALAEDVAPAAPVVPIKTLPPRVDLAYKVFYGAGFWIGSATYRFEHSGNRYRIATVGEARGLAALLLRGKGRMESSGLITRAGLQPHEFVVDKFNARGAERADFDWESGVATLHGDKVAPLELPTYDILALMWQFYFQPPQSTRQDFALATTRRLMRASVARERNETIQWGRGDIETEVWHRTSDDGKTEAYVWLAPSMRWLPIKMRVISTTRGTVEALLDQIRVDERYADGGDATQPSEAPLPRTEPEPVAREPEPQHPPQNEHSQ
ncbi:MAG TPA: DUF3108 domain-containing protein [Casimicrobiaceae bacterium]|nr:DUF3108 domain-containing protein [Casimicrobiaceae bacterium]